MIQKTLIVLLIASLWGCSSPDSGKEEKGITGTVLRENFKSPPDAARPGAYWYFMDGNQTREAMTTDLEAMHEAGLRKALFLEVNLGLPRGPVDFMSEKWQENFAHAVRHADQLGMEIILGTGPGWAGAGGPWIDPPMSMQHLRASAVHVEGPGPFTGILPVPEPRQPVHFAGLSDTLSRIRQKWHADVAVLAFPTPAEAEPPELLDVKALYETEPYSIWKHVPRYIPSQADYPEPPAEACIAPERIVDLTDKLGPDGSLDWEIPEGEWTIMRFAARNTGATTRPAPKPGHGFETDKFNPDAFAYHFNHFHQKLMDRIGPRAAGRGWTAIHLDSWEMSSQNWSENFRREFEKRRGYDPQPFFPAYTGLLVGSREKTERFLWDLRKTAQELVIENHAKVIRDHAHKHGFYYSNQPYDMNPAGDIALGSVADVPSCEFWVVGGPDAVYGCVESVSIAHTMGRPVVRAEAFTSHPGSGYKHNPQDMKNQTDWAFSLGINDLIFHTYQHQPLGTDGPKPGMAMGPHGIHWHRNQTFWPMVNPYHDYIARCGYMLRQGVSVADILYLTPEGAPHIFLPPEDAMTSDGQLREKKGYSFDAVTPRILLSKAAAEDGRIAFEDGTSYRVLVLPATAAMTPELLTRIDELVRAGITVVGVPPVRSPGLTDYPRCDQEVATLTQKLWGGKEAPATVNERDHGKGRVIWGGDATIPVGSESLYPSYASTAALLKQWDVPPVFESTGPVRYHQRRTGNHDIFFVSNREADPAEVTATFRTDGTTPALWNPVTGEIRPLPGFTTGKETASIPLRFDRHESYFIVFNRGEAASQEVPEEENFPQATTVTTLEGPWKVSFDPAWGGPDAPVTFEALQPWNARETEGIRYYSGEAVYRKTFSLPAGSAENEPLWLDLGEVHKMARIKLNGEALGIVWTPPFRVDVSGHVKADNNELEITVVNTWVNRLIGDQQPENKGVRELQWESGLLGGETFPAGRYTFTTASGDYTAGSPLQESGLLGPVKLLSTPE